MGCHVPLLWNAQAQLSETDPNLDHLGTRVRCGSLRTGTYRDSDGQRGRLIASESQEAGRYQVEGVAFLQGCGSPSVSTNGERHGAATLASSE